MVQLRNLGNICYTGSFRVIHKEERFWGTLGTSAGRITFLFWRDLSCSFSFTDTSQMHKLKVHRGRVKFHKMSDEARQAKRARKQARQAKYTKRKMN